MSEKKEFIEGRDGVTFVDLFAGAGGISEGFLQAYTDKKYYDFLLASDINANCELTHRVRYNHQLGLGTGFLCQDIMDDTFVEHIKEQIGGRRVDVVTGGPSCQSFSLSGRRRKFDKRDDLFYHYLKVIKALRPKYFVMENVKGILTKDHGKIKDKILREIRSIVDDTKVNLLFDFIKKAFVGQDSYAYTTLICKINIETCEPQYREQLIDSYFSSLENQFKQVTKDIEYKVSKSDTSINTVRHGLRMLKEGNLRSLIRKNVIALKTKADVDNDLFGDRINEFIGDISDSSILEKMSTALDDMANLTSNNKEVNNLRDSLSLYVMTLDEVLELIGDKVKGTKFEGQYPLVCSQIRLYNIDSPLVLLSSDYGVPQNRERVVFIGCRNDQKIIKGVPATVAPEDKVTVYEALWDLDMIGNGETVTEYKPVTPNQHYIDLLRNRLTDGTPDATGKLYSQWQREGRLAHRFAYDAPPTYVRDAAGLKNATLQQHYELNNHQTSSQNDTVRERLSMIATHGGYDEETKKALQAAGLDSDKRNYTVLNPKGQSPTVVTMPDDFIHYSAHRAMTVREMARLQSFDDSFVFQGKRQTGGEKRKEEIPQFTLVGNAVPPLMARAIGNVILNCIE